MSHKNRNLITILLTTNRQIFKVAESLLNDAGIEYFIKNNGTLEGGAKLDTSKGPVEIQVSRDISIKARTLLADLQELDFDEKKK